MTPIDRLNQLAKQLSVGDQQRLIDFAAAMVEQKQSKREKRRKRFEVEPISFSVLGD